MAYSNRKPLASINVTPLVDVLLILLVVVMLTMPLFVKRLPVELPKTAINGAPVAVKSLSIAILPDGSLALEGIPSSIEGVLSRVDDTVTIELAIDAKITYDTMAKVIARIQEKNPKEVALIVQ